MLALRPLTDPAGYCAIRLSALATDPGAFGSVHAVEAARPLAEHEARLLASLVIGAFDGGEVVGMIGFRRESGPKDAHKGVVWGFFV